MSSIGFGAFKIGRNEKTKYPAAYDLPSDPDVDRLLGGLFDLGINYIDTAPAYGASEERIGQFLASRRREFVLATKVGETFAGGARATTFRARACGQASSAVCAAADRRGRRAAASFRRPRPVDPKRDRRGRRLAELKERGLVRAIGLSGKTVEGAPAGPRAGPTC